MYVDIPEQNRGQLAFVGRKDVERIPRAVAAGPVRPGRTGHGRVRVRVHERTRARGRDNLRV